MKVPNEILFDNAPVPSPKESHLQAESVLYSPETGGRQQVGPSQEKAPDGRVTGTHNELLLLHAIERLGHSTSWQLSMMSRLSRRSVQRVLKRLQDRRMVSMKRLPDGDPVYVMRQAGASELSLHLGREVRRTNDDASFIKSRLWRHRKLANDTACELSQRHPVLTEREIQAGRNPAGRRDILPGKVPDLMFKTSDGWTWVEVERAWKKRREYRRLIHTVEMITKPKLERRPGPMLAGDAISSIVFLVSDELEARRHITRFSKHYNLQAGYDIPDHLIAYFRSVGVMWWERRYLRFDDAATLFYSYC
ncbi:replication-relaxation family protein [Thioalkalivibrio sp. ALJ3]|uniref:replication-relaxation family protein n=1 Tax=Thioalkalivibrio sp. ALJ3 TaxID=1240557 RepID=UPI0003702964|nr:replication-relaxation family protein [Thioalkalivibrio sp. ALJ3]